MTFDHDGLAGHERNFLRHVARGDDLVASPQLVGVRGHIC
jgi:hypothetical protein